MRNLLSKVLAGYTLCLSILHYQTEATRLECYECDSVGNVQNCSRVVLCGEHQHCFEERILRNGIHESFKLGCMDVSVCSQAQFPLIGKRSPIVIPRSNDFVTCMQCCTGPFCNGHLCQRKHTIVYESSTRVPNKTAVPDTSQQNVSQSPTSTASTTERASVLTTRFPTKPVIMTTASTFVPNTTVVPFTLSQHTVTQPPSPTRCAQCSGPPEICEHAFQVADCLPPNNYCINHVKNLASGAKLIDRRCGNFQTCYKDWYLGTSDDDRCRRRYMASVITYRFECTYCCTKDSCNVDLYPKDDSLFIPS